MRNKLSALFLICAFALVCSGCRLAQTPQAQTLGKDSLVGVFVTTEHLDLFDIESYLNDHLSDLKDGEIKIEGDSHSYEGRIYAVPKKSEVTDIETGKKATTTDFVFENLDGFSMYEVKIQDENESYHSFVGAGFADVKTHLKSSHNGQEISIEGTLFVNPTAENLTFYANPIYQAADGSIYLTAGQGMTAAGTHDEGAWMSTNLADSTTITADGKTETLTNEVTVNISVMFPPEKINVIEMGANGETIAKTELSADVFPEEYQPSDRTQYIIVESVKTDLDKMQYIAAEVFDKKDTSFFVFQDTGKGICEKIEIPLLWK